MGAIPIPATADTARGLAHTDTVTVYNLLGESGRRAVYRRTVVVGVRAEERSGAVATMRGSSSVDGLEMFVSPLPGYAAPEAFAASASGSPHATPVPEGRWTLRAGDLIVAGVCELDLPPATIQQLESGRRVYRVTGVEAFSDRRGRLHHLEVVAS